MVKAITLTSDNLIEDSYNNTYKYSFPVGSVNFYKGDEIALVGLNMYQCWYNVTVALNNNSFSYTWFQDGNPYGSGVTYTVTIPDGAYTITTLNEFLQWTMINNLTYLEDGDNYVYFLEFVNNNTFNRLQLVCYALPSALGSYSYPSGATWTLPAAATCPVLTVSSDNKFGTLIGFTAGDYPSTYKSTDYTVLGDYETKFHGNQSSVIVTCNLVRNTFSIPSTLLAIVPVTNVTFGEVIEYNPGSPYYLPCQTGQFYDLYISFLNESDTPLKLERNIITIFLTFRRSDDKI
jgi:hypothetical protein